MKPMPFPDPAYGAEPNSRIDLLYLFDILRTNFRWVLLATFAAIAAGYLYLSTVTPIYTAYAQVLIDTRRERISPVEEVMSNLDLSSAVLAGEVQSIRANVLIGKVVDRLNLTEHPSFDPRAPQSEGRLAWLKRLARGGDPPHIEAQRQPIEVIRNSVIDKVRFNLNVQQVGLSYVISVSFKSSNNVLAAEITNAVADEYVRSLREAKQGATLRVNSWLADRLVELSAEVETADQAVVDFREKLVAETGGSPETVAQLLAELNSRLVTTSADRADAEVRLTQLEALVTQRGISAAAELITSTLLETLQRQRSELAARQAEMGSTYGRRHPDMIRIAAQIGDIDRSIETELRRQSEVLRSAAEVARSREAALQDQIAAVSARVDRTARASVELDQLRRTADATRLVYENFLSRFKETSAQGDFQSPEARIIGEASVPVVPSSPRRTLTLLIAAVAGFCLGIMAVFLRSALVVPVRTGSELRHATGLPLLAALPFVRQMRGGHSWLRRELLGHGHSVFMESIRSIRTRLLDGTQRPPSKVVMVTSSLAAEGKSSVCFALARAASTTEGRVVLVDADLRRSDSVKVLGLAHRGPCLIDHLEGKIGSQNLAEKSTLLNCDIILPRRRTEQAADLLASPAMEALMRELARDYDFIVLNAPPVLNLADTLILAKLADTTLFVVQSGRTPMRVLLQMLQRLNDSGVDIAGTVMTQVRRQHVAGREVYSYSYQS